MDSDTIRSHVNCSDLDAFVPQQSEERYDLVLGHEAAFCSHPKLIGMMLEVSVGLKTVAIWVPLSLV